MTSKSSSLASAASSADSSFRTDAPTAPMTSCKSKEWIDFRLVDKNGKPMAGVRFRLDSSDGRSAEGFTDEDGCAGADELDPGQCRATWLPPRR